MTTMTKKIPQAFGRLAAEAMTLLHQTLELSWTLLKIMLPVLLVTKIMLELGVIHWIGRALGPIMGLVGLPGSMGLYGQPG